MNEKQYPIGIDLGTVNSVLAVHRNNKTEIIQCQGFKITPSNVFYDPDGDVIVGDLEDADIADNTSNVIHDSKRLIGRNFKDEWVQSNCKKFGFSIEDTKTNGIHIPIKQNDNKVYKTPQEVSSEILKLFKKTAVDYLGYEVDEAVITVPAYFTFSQRNATKQAANLAGLKVLMLLNEPTAACLHYIKERVKKNSLSLVFDLGGGTLDIAIVRLSETGIKVVAVDGDTLLGGRNFDQAVLDYVINTHNLTVNKRDRERLLKSLEKMKHTLSFKDNISRRFEEFNGKHNFKLNLTQKEFEHINLPLFEKCVNIIKRCLNKANIQKEDIENIILVGGSTKIPKIKQMVQEFFGGKQVSTDLDPDEAVACGAAIQAACMKGLVTAKFKIVDVTPFSLGVSAMCDRMRIVINCNTPIPAQNSIEGTMIDNFQSELEIYVYEGERSRCKYNNFLGKFTVENLPKKPAGEVEVNVVFAIDESGLLKVTAKEESTGITSELEVGIELHDLKSNNFVSITNEIEEDKQFLEYAYKLTYLRYRCMQHICDKNDNEKNVIECKKFMNELQILEFEERDKLNDLVKNFTKMIDDNEFIKEILFFENIPKLLELDILEFHRHCSTNL